MNNYFDSKDAMRIRGIITRANGSGRKELMYTAAMANSITDSAKAQRRGNAADAIGRHDIARFFFVRFGQLIGR
jgi:hypothetical protein